MAEHYKSISQRKLIQRDSKIPAEWRLASPPPANVLNVLDVPRNCGILDPVELDITENYDATALAHAIATRKLSCVQVTTAFCKRAAIAQQLTNCLTEIYFDSALERAAALDYHLANPKAKPVGPLHGVPVSLKDMFCVAGSDASIGIAAFCNQPSTATAPLVNILIEAGAVIYCKTNVPQTMMALDSDNSIFGRTLNPINRRVTAGGSSGGEGALIGMRGSILGIGTDIGGSIRIPAMCNNIYGIKPSANRLPMAGCRSTGRPAGEVMALRASAGPMATSMRDCELLMQVMAAARPWELDPAIVPGTWDSSDSTAPGPRPLNIGIMRTNDTVTPLPPIQRILDEVEEALTKAGHRVVPITPPSLFKDAQNLTDKMFTINGNEYIFDAIKRHGEDFIKWLKPFMKRRGPVPLDTARDLHAQRNEIMTQMLGIWRAPDGRGGTLEVDAIVCPVAPHPTPEIDRWLSVGYTSSMVLLDLPAGTVPVRTVQQRDLDMELPTDVPPLGKWDAMNRTLWYQDKAQRQVYLGTPLCVQVIAPRLQEKRLCRAMIAVDDAVHASDVRRAKSNL